MTGLPNDFNVTDFLRLLTSVAGTPSEHWGLLGLPLTTLPCLGCVSPPGPPTGHVSAPLGGAAGAVPLGGSPAGPADAAASSHPAQRGTRREATTLSYTDSEAASELVTPAEAGSQCTQPPHSRASVGSESFLGEAVHPADRQASSGPSPGMQITGKRPVGSCASRALSLPAKRQALGLDPTTAVQVSIGAGVKWSAAYCCP
jgi:hypothetical protein